MFHDKFLFLRQILMTVPLHRVSMVEFVPTNLMIIDVTVVLDGVARTVISVRYFCSSGLISARYQAIVYHSSLEYQFFKQIPLSPSLPRSRFVARHATLGGTLRDETQNGGEGDYWSLLLTF